MKTYATNTAFLSRHSIVAAAILGLTVVASHAASITWGTPQGITNDFDVSTLGTLVNAVNIGAAGVTSPTVNGVTFNGVVFTGSSVSSGNFSFAGALASSNTVGAAAPPFSNLTAPYQALLGTVGGTAAGSFTLTMTGLSLGSQYQVEFWSNVSNGSGSANQGTTVTAGNSIVLNDSPGGAAGAVGQFGIGTFTADAPTQQITINQSSPAGTYVNAVQLRSIPEPGTTLLLALGASLGCAFRRRRQARE